MLRGPTWLIALAGGGLGLAAAVGGWSLARAVRDPFVAGERGDPGGWHLTVDETCRAVLRYGAGSDVVWQIDLTRVVPGRGPWTVQFHAPPSGVRAEREYRVRLRARADRRRTMVVAIGQAHPPWQNLGLHQEVSLGPEWTGLELACRPTGDDPQARLEFFLGSAAGRVELTEIELTPLAEPTSAE